MNMGNLIKHGGPPIWVVLLFGLILLVDAILIARRPDERKLAFLRAMSLAQLFAMVAGFTAGVAKSIQGCRGLPPALKDQWPLFVALGTSEALADIILGAAFLALAWFVAAIGVRRIVTA
jgi:hypothetical protein